MASSGITLSPLSLKAINVGNPQQLQQAWFSMCDILNQLVVTTTTASGLAAILNDSAVIAAGSFSQVSVNASVSTNQTVNCAGAAQVAIIYTWTAAANPTITLTNLSAGTLVFIRLFNTSGAARTVIFSATTPALAAYSISAVLSVGQAVWSVGASVNNNAFGSILAMAQPGPVLAGVGTNG